MASFVGPLLRRARTLSLGEVRCLLAAGLGGGLATVVDVGALIALVEAGVPIATAAFIATALGGVFCFVWNKYLAFRDRSALAVGQVVRYGSVALATALLMALAMELVAVDMHVPYVLAKLACSLLVFGAWTYPAQRLLVFRVVVVPSARDPRMRDP